MSYGFKRDDVKSSSGVLKEEKVNLLDEIPNDDIELKSLKTPSDVWKFYNFKVRTLSKFDL